MKKVTNSAGAIFIALIVAIVAIAAISLGISKISSVSVLNQLQLNQFDKARDLAYGGLEYVRGLNYYYQNNNKTFSEFYNALTSNGGVYDLGGDVGSFIVTISSYSTTSNVTSYTVSVVGVASAGYNYAKYQIPNSETISYTYSSPSVQKVPQTLMQASTINFSGNTYTGDSIFSAYSFNGGVVINGSLDYIGTGSACLVLKGSRIGLTDKTSHICSNTCIEISGGVVVYGTVKAQGDVNVSNGTVNGDIYAGGNVTISGGSTVNGVIYAAGSVTISNGYAKSDVRAKGDVAISSWSGHIEGNVYVHGTCTYTDRSLISGSIIALSEDEAPSVPTKCSGSSLPTYASQEENQTDPNNTKGSIKYTITGSTDITNTNYVFPSFTILNGGSKLCLDLSTPDSYINIFVNGSFAFNGTIQLMTSSTGGCKDASSYTLDQQKTYAKKIYMAVGGTTTFNSSAHLWIGTIFSQGDILGKSTLDVVGALYSNGTIDTGGGSSSIFVMSDYANLTWN